MAKNPYNNSYPSVTQILGVLRKPALEMWFKYHTSKFCDEESKKGLEVGTQIHEAIKSNIEQTEVKVTTEYPEEVMTALRSFMLFKKENPEIKLNFSEIPMTSIKYHYNGTMDVIGTINNELIVGDWKTSKAKDKDKPDLYDEYFYQVSAYCYLYNEINKTEIRKAFIVSLAKDKIAYNLKFFKEVEIIESFHEVFLPCLRIINYQRRNKK